MRVYDELRAANFHVERYMDFVEVIPEAMTEAEVILADNVADYFMSHGVTTKEGADPLDTLDAAIDLFDFPVLTPPFPRMFIEYHFRSSWLSDLVPNLRLHGFVRLGAFVNAIELGHDTRQRISRRFHRDVRWRVQAAIYMEPIPFRIVGPILQVRFDVDSDGRSNRESIAMAIPGKVQNLASEYCWDEKAGKIVITQEARMAVTPLLLTICFMNCKNVTLETVRPERNMPKQFKRRKTMPYTEYKILDIRPMHSILRNEGKVHEVGLKKALHVCRGHFKTYTPDSPLFGKVEGTFWWGNFARGSGPARVIKDYRVHAPEKQRNQLLEGQIGGIRE